MSKNVHTLIKKYLNAKKYYYLTVEGCTNLQFVKKKYLQSSVK